MSSAASATEPRAHRTFTPVCSHLHSSLSDAAASRFVESRAPAPLGPVAAIETPRHRATSGIAVFVARWGVGAPWQPRTEPGSAERMIGREIESCLSQCLRRAPQAGRKLYDTHPRPGCHDRNAARRRPPAVAAPYAGRLWPHPRDGGRRRRRNRLLLRHRAPTDKRSGSSTNCGPILACSTKPRCSWVTQPSTCVA